MSDRRQTLIVFSDLAKKYSNWTDLCSYLTSKEGGSLRVIEPADNNLAIVRYTNGVSDFTLDHVGKFRSVVWDKVKNRPVSVAPPRAETGLPSDGATVRITEFADGTMIHAWKDSEGKVGIATRTSLGARGTFYSSRSFADLFNEALLTSDGTEKFLEASLKPNQFMSLVLQHKEHKIVAPISNNRVIVTHFGEINDSGEATFYNHFGAWPGLLPSYAPNVYEDEVTVSDVMSIIQKHEQSIHTWQGLVFQSMDSEKRWKWRNSGYMTARALRGSEANPMERFLRLRANDEVKKYVSFFREDSNEMWTMEELLRTRTDELYQVYGEMNKRKSRGMRDIPYSFRPHVYALHGKYLNTLPTPVPIVKETVVKYVNELPLEEQLKILQGTNAGASSNTAPSDANDA